MCGFRQWIRYLKSESSRRTLMAEWLYEETWTDSYLLRYYGIDASKKGAQIKRCKELRRKIVQSLGGEPGKYYAVIALDADNMGEKNREAESQEQHEKRSKALIEYTETARRIVEQDYLGKFDLCRWRRPVSTRESRRPFTNVERIARRIPLLYECFGRCMHCT